MAVPMSPPVARGEATNKLPPDIHGVKGEDEEEQGRNSVVIADHVVQASANRQALPQGYAIKRRGSEGGGRGRHGVSRVLEEAGNEAISVRERIQQYLFSCNLYNRSIYW
ncbi:hypothetical protein ACP4OV_021182 [Aristida adscensionis]